MPKTALNELTVKHLKAPARGQLTYWDTGLTGFGVRVSQGGSKSFVVMHGQNRRRITIGPYPRISLSAARGQAKTLIAELTLGKHRQPSLRFEEALDLFVETHCKVHNRPGTAKETERLLRKHFLPAFRHEHLGDITPHEVSRQIDRLLKHPSLANHAFTALRTFFRWAVKRHYLEHSPCEGMSLPARTTSRSRVLTEDEIVRIYKAADDYPFGAIVRLLILTGQRRGEIAALRRSYIDGDTVTLPGDLTKNAKAHTFPINATAQAIITKVPNTGDLLFPARGKKKDRPFSGWSKTKGSFTCDVEDWTLHDLRRSFSTHLAALGTAPHIIERLLNHTSGGSISRVAAVYNHHHYLADMRHAVEAWEAKLLPLLAR